MTNDLRRRVFEHGNDLEEGFTKQCRCHRLVYYESFDDVTKAIDCEKAAQALESSEEGLAD
jgi:putative endonuclease